MTVATNAVELAKAGHKVSVIGNYDRDYSWKLPGVDVYPIFDRGRGGSLRHRVTTFVNRRTRLREALSRLSRESQIDIVEWPDFDGLFLQPIANISDVVRNHGPLMSHRLAGLVSRKPYIEYMEMRMLRRIPNWIGISEWFMDQWLRISHARPIQKTVLYNTVDCNLFHPGDSTREDNLILYCGNMIERKGALALSRAANLFLSELPRAELWFVGRDTAQGRAHSFAEIAADLRPRVRYLDPMPQSEIADLMRRATIFAMPSLLESFGNVWAEAMASALPVLGSTTSCGPEVVPDGEAGLLADPTDPRDIANKIVRLMQDDELRARLGMRGCEVALERYSTAAIIPRTIAFYQLCTAGQDETHSLHTHAS